MNPFLRKAINFTAIISVFSIAIALNYVYEEVLFDYSVEVYPSIQEAFPDWAISIFEVITHLGSLIGAILLIGIFLCFYSVDNCLVFLWTYTFGIFLVSCLKVIYSYGRPFWINDKITPYSCEGGFGSPSGHSMSITFFAFTLWYKAFGKLLKDSKNKPYSLEEDVKNQIIKWAVFAVMVIVALSVMFSRILLGVHSIDQVIYGCSISIAMMISFYGIIDIYEEFSESLDFFYYNMKGILLLVGFFVTHIIVITSLILFIPSPKDQPKWNDVLELKCQDMDEFKKFKGESIIGSAIVAITIGAWLGSLAFVRVSQIVKVKELFNFQPSDLCKRFECFGILIGFLIVPFTIHFIPVGDNFWAVLFVKYIIPFLLSFFVCFFPGFMLLRFLKLTKEFEKRGNSFIENEISNLGV